MYSSIYVDRMKLSALLIPSSLHKTAVKNVCVCGCVGGGGSNCPNTKTVHKLFMSGGLEWYHKNRWVVIGVISG